MAKHEYATVPAKHQRDAAGRSLHHRERSGRAFLVLRDALDPDHFHDPVPRDERWASRSHGRRRSAAVFRAVCRRRFISCPSSARSWRKASSANTRPFSGSRSSTASAISPSRSTTPGSGSLIGLGLDRVRLRRHQAVRLGQRGRPVWRIEQAPALESFWLVLFFDQRRLVHLHDCFARSCCTTRNWGPRWAFGIPGIAMVIATIFFWAGRKKFVHIPPAGLGFRKADVQPGRPRRARPAGDRLCFRGRLLVALGSEQRRFLDACRREQMDLALGFGMNLLPCPGPDGEPDLDPALHPAGELRDLSGDR